MYSKSGKYLFSMCIFSVSTQGQPVYAAIESAVVFFYYYYSSVCIDEEYWSRGYTLAGEDGCAPRFLSSQAHTILTCGKALNLLRICKPSVSCWELSTPDPFMRTFSIRWSTACICCRPQTGLYEP